MRGEIMSKSMFYHRTRLLNLMRSKNFMDTRTAVMVLFQDIKPDKKESVARRLYPLIKKCETDNDVIRTAYSVIESLNACDRVGKIPCKQRLAMVQLLTEKGFSVVAQLNIMRNLIETARYDFRREMELTAEKCIPLVQKCQTEEEAIEVVTQYIEEEFADLLEYRRSLPT
jgi:hypothetical protein